MNVSLTPQLEQFVKEKVATGNYTSASEVMREALRLLKEEDRLKETHREPKYRTLEQRKQAMKAAAGLWKDRTDLSEFSELRSDWDRQR